jgi:NAD(P)-dependent dehydrogenase (short-subunit alcohol dehydrogenase family)
VTRNVAVVTSRVGDRRVVARALLDAGGARAAGRRAGAGGDRGRHGRGAGRADDVADPASVTDLFAAARGEWGRVDLLVNNAGTFGPVGGVDLSRSRVVVDGRGQPDRRLPVCAGGRGDDEGAGAAGRADHQQRLIWRTRRGRGAPPTPTKHAITGLTKSLSLDGRPFGIACGQIDIGNAATDMTAGIAARPAADGGVPEPTFDARHVAEAVLLWRGCCWTRTCSS